MFLEYRKNSKKCEFFCIKERIVGEWRGMYTLWFLSQKWIRAFYNIDGVWVEFWWNGTIGSWTERDNNAWKLTRGINTVSNTAITVFNEFWRDESWAKTPEEKISNNLINDLFSVLKRTYTNPQKILDSEKYKNLPKKVREVTQRMIDFWELDLAFERSPNRLQTVEEAIKRAIKWEDCLMFYANWRHGVLNINNYRKTIIEDVSHLHINVLWWILKNGENLKKYVYLFDDATWGNISVYLEARQYESKLLNWLNPDLFKPFISRMAENKRSEEKRKVDPMISEIKKQFAWSPEVQRAIETMWKGLWVPLLPNGEVDFKSLEKTHLAKPENQGKDERIVMRDLGKSLWELRKDLEIFTNKVKTERDGLIKKVWTKSSLSDYPWLSGINTKVQDARWKESDLAKTPLQTINGTHARQILAEIGKKYPNNVPKELIDIILLLGLQLKLQESRSILWQVSEGERQTKTWKKKIDQQKTSLAGKTSEASGALSDAKEVLGNKTDTELQNEQKILENKPNRTEEEEKRLATIRQSRQHTNDLAQIYSQTRKQYWEQEAQEIFQESIQVGRWFPLAKNEKIDFPALEKIATMTDPEASQETKSLYTLTIQDPPMRLENTSGYEEGYFLGSSGLFAKSVGEGFVQLTDKSWSPLVDLKLRPYQVESVKKEVLTLQSIGMESLLPLISQMSTIIGGWYRVNSFDGEMSDGEIKRLLQGIEKLVLVDGESPSTGENIDRIKSFRSRASNHGRLPREYYDTILRQNWYLNDDGTPRIDAITKKIQA